MILIKCVTNIITHIKTHIAPGIRIVPPRDYYQRIIIIFKFQNVYYIRKQNIWSECSMMSECKDCAAFTDDDVVECRCLLCDLK